MCAGCSIGANDGKPLGGPLLLAILVLILSTGLAKINEGIGRSSYAGPMPKSRVPVPQAVAAQALFLADRTCCVCRDHNKPIQLHHIDENPSNNDLSNLAVLCIDCHNKTQIRGGFDRKLDAEQIILYRDDWNRVVAARRSPRDGPSLPKGQKANSHNVKYTTSLAEAYRESGEWELLAVLYDKAGNETLRDKYIEIGLDNDPDDAAIISLRGLQGRPELIPTEVVERELQRHTENNNWTQRARLYMKLRRYREACEDYVRGILVALEEGRNFSAAYYLRELVNNDLITSLYVKALQEAADEGDLWWQARALQDLGWQDELKAFLLSNSEEIDESGKPMLKQLLASARGETDRALDEAIAIFSSARRVRFGVTMEKSDPQ
jgi:tetratricopeptide (TPR) repeat protein